MDKPPNDSENAAFNGRYRNRTCDPLIKNQLPQNDNNNQNKNLSKDQKGDYKPAYKENPETAEKETQKMPDNLAEIVAVWPELRKITIKGQNRNKTVTLSVII